jgi:putative glutamine amidotransferase
MAKPLIGIPMESNYHVKDRKTLTYGGMPTYVRAVELNGGAAIFIPLQLGEESLRNIYERLDGLLLSGGVDVHPKEYGEEVAEYCGPIDPLRDETELKLAQWALRHRKPLLAICRGAQLLNVAAGGSLVQDIYAQHPDPIEHRYDRENFKDRWHPIVVEEGTRLAHAFGATQLDVNTAHHQALKKVGDNLRVIAHAPDHIVEAVEGADGAFVLGVQFHPERMLEQEPRAHGIFRAFVEACRGE